jgi:hypothetical protein
MYCTLVTLVTHTDRQSGGLSGALVVVEPEPFNKRVSWEIESPTSFVLIN